MEVQIQNMNKILIISQLMLIFSTTTFLSNLYVDCPRSVLFRSKWAVNTRFRFRSFIPVATFAGNRMSDPQALAEAS